MTGMDRSAEFDAFKQLNLSLIASAYGYEIVKKKSTRHSVLMESNSDKIVISQKQGRYVYFSVHDPVSAGTVIDFAQKVIEPGCSLGRVRQLLRPYLGGGGLAELEHRQQGRFQQEVHENEPDLNGVAARYTDFKPIDQPHKYLCEARGIPFQLLKSERVHGRVRHCPRRGSIVFPHWDSTAAMANPETAVCGYEIKGRGVNLFSKGGRKGLWMSARLPGDSGLAFTESGLDALSYLAVRGELGTAVCSVSGQLNARQPELIRALIESLNEDATIVAAFDNDQAGDRLTEKLGEILAETERSDLNLRVDRPAERGRDWNQVLASLHGKFTGAVGQPPSMHR